MHPGGPFWAKKDQWMIPKGELEDNEDHKTAALREFEEELGIKPPDGEFIDLGQAKQGNKINFVWAIEGNPDLSNFKSNTFSMEWPPKSGRQQEFTEIDRAEWFDLTSAKSKLFKTQTEFIDRLAVNLDLSLEESPKFEQQSLI